MFKKIIFYLFLSYTLVGTILLPYFLKPQLIEIIESQTNSKISIESISFNPFIFKIALNNVELRSLEDKHLVSFKSLSINAEPSSLLFSSYHIKEFVLEKPQISLVYNKDKTFNILSVIKPSEETPKEDNNASLPRIKLDTIAIVDGSLAYEDFTNPSKFDFAFGNIGFSLKDIDTNDFNSSEAKLRFYSNLEDGGFIDLKSNVIGFKPFTVEGSLDFQASKLYTQWRYMQDALNLEVANGKLSFHSNYYLNVDDLNSTKIDNLRVALTGLRIKPKKEHKDVLNLDSLYLENITVLPMQKSVHIPKIALDSLSLKASRNVKGEIDWLEYVKVDIGESNTSEEETPQDDNKTQHPWSVVVDELSLEKIKVAFADKGVKPNVNTDLNSLNIYAQNITLAGKEPLKYQMNLLLNEKFKCNSEGDIVHNVLNINSYTKCDDFDIVHYRPYIDEIAKQELAKYDIKLIDAVAGFDSVVNVIQKDEEFIIDASKTNVYLDKFALNKTSSKEKLVAFNSFRIKDLALNTEKKSVDVANISLNGLETNAVRLKDGTLNIDEIIVPKKSQKVVKKKTSKKEKEYRVKVKHFSLNDAKASFIDKLLTPSVKSKLDRTNVHLYDIDSAKKSWLTYSLSSRVNSKGYIKSKGSLKHTPLSQKGSLELKKISLSELNPYLSEKAYVALGDGDLSMKSKIRYTPSSVRPDLRVQGSLYVNNIFLNDTRTDMPILSFNELGLKSFTLEALPNRLFIDEVNLHSFYVDALINEKKELNFALLAKETKNEKTNTEEVVKNKDKNSTKNKEAFPIKILKLGVHNGSAKFADLSIPIQFKTHIHDLNGYVYSISSNPSETSYIDILGEIDKYGSTKLKGNINSASPKEYTDLDLSFSNITLNSFSGYSANFAGHKIDNGKLFLDLGYKINASEIRGSNSVIIKQMELGDEIEDENITSIPLGFIIGLLEDSDGIIDIEMPVEGNLDEPDFKYGTLVFETFGNLLLKAVSAPFTFLSSMMGMDKDTLQYSEFEPGETHITPPQREKLDQIAKMMIKRPKINLGISGTYDEVYDKRALQMEKLVLLVLKKSGIENRAEQKSAMTIDILEDIYEDIKDDDRLDEIEDSLEKQYEGKEFDAEYRKALIKETSNIQVITKKELEQLAKDRAEAVKNYWVNDKNIPVKRFHTLEVLPVKDSTKESVKIKFEIEVK